MAQPEQTQVQPQQVAQQGMIGMPQQPQQPQQPMPASAAPSSLYVGDLAPDVNEALLFDIFNAVGPVASVRVCRDAATRRSLGYAYVNFHRSDDADRALDTMNFASIRGRPCRIMWSHRDPSLRRSGAGNVFVKNLHGSIDNKTLYDTFSMFGNILSCKVVTNDQGQSLGYGFVHYESEDSATRAIENVNGMEIAGLTVSVAKFKGRSDRVGDKDSFTNVFVKNLPEDMTSERLQAMFEKFGKVTSHMLAVDEEGKPRGFGFVNFEGPEAAAEAVKALNGSDVGDRKLFVGRAQKKQERERELRRRFEMNKLERQKKYAGVNLYVKNLTDTVDKDMLIQEFSKHGAITSARIMTDETGKSKGFGFVCFSSPEEATKAVTEMNGKMLDGKPLYVALAQRKEVRQAQLEAQHSARAKAAGVMPGPMGMMYPPQFFQPGRPGLPPAAFPPQMMGYPPQQQLYQQQLYQQQQQQMMQQRQGQPQRMNGGGGGRGAKKGGGGMKNPPQMQMMPMQPQMMPGQPMMVQPLTAQALAAAPVEMQKKMIGERLFPLIMRIEPERAGKITGMLLEMDNSELLHLLESGEALTAKCQEAVEVLREHESVAQ